MDDGDKTHWWINSAMNSYRKVLGPYAWCVYDYLASRVRTKNKSGEDKPLQECWVQQAVIARDLGISRREVQRALDKLELHSLIYRDPPQGFGQRNHYVLLKVEPWVASQTDAPTRRTDASTRRTVDAPTRRPLMHTEKQMHTEEVKQEPSLSGSPSGEPLRQPPKSAVVAPDSLALTMMDLQRSNADLTAEEREQRAVAAQQRFKGFSATAHPQGRRGRAA